MKDKHYPLTGKLIIVEGVDGSGKSTQIRLLEKWLRYIGMPVFFTEWNSSEQVKEIISKGKKKEPADPHHFQPAARDRLCRKVREKHLPTLARRLHCAC